MKYGWMLAIGLGLSVASGRAALVSLYTFDCTGDSAIPGAPSGTFDGPKGAYFGPQFSGADGPIAGGKALKFDGTDDSLNLGKDAFPKTSRYGETSNGIWTGSASFWIKTPVRTGHHIILGAACSGDNTTFEIQLHGGKLQLHIEAARSTSSSGLFQVQQAPQATDCCDDNWHHLVLTWNITTGRAGTGTASFYVDGKRQDIVKLRDDVAGSDVFSPWNWPVRLGGLGRDKLYENYCFKGVLDDFGLWNQQLSDAKARALYGVAKDAALNYGVQDAQDLFETFEEGPGAQSVVRGKTWQYASGLPGSPGQVVGNRNAVLFDGRGKGVQMVAEPASAATGTNPVVHKKG